MKTTNSFATKLGAAAVYLAAALMLSGCVAAALYLPYAIPAAHAVSGTRDSSIVITIDDKTFTSKVRDVLVAARHWSAVSEHVSEAKAWEGFATRAGIRVSLERPTVKVDGLMMSERRDLLNKMCSNFKSDIAVLETNSTPKAGNTLAGAVTARAKISGSGTMHVLACHGRLPLSFDYTYEVDSGLYNADLQLNDEMGKAFFEKLLSAMGITEQTLASRASQTAPIPATESKDAGTTKPTGTEPKSTTAKPKSDKAKQKGKPADSVDVKKP